MNYLTPDEWSQIADLCENSESNQIQAIRALLREDDTNTASDAIYNELSASHGHEVASLVILAMMPCLIPDAISAFIHQQNRLDLFNVIGSIPYASASDAVEFFAHDRLTAADADKASAADLIESGQALDMIERRAKNRTTMPF